MLKTRTTKGNPNAAMRQSMGSIEARTGAVVRMASATGPLPAPAKSWFGSNVQVLSGGRALHSKLTGLGKLGTCGASSRDKL
jgi:hypothetical protein